MHFAYIIPSEQTLKDYYPIRDNVDKLLNDILDFVVQSQNHFSIKSRNVERWEVKTKTWMEQNKEIIDQHMKELGFVDEILPKTQDIGILGATKGSMEISLNYAAHLFNSNLLEAKHLILLASERPVSLQADATDDELLKIAEKYKLK